MNITILHFDSLTSTNTEAINQAKQGADEGLSIVADYQSAGRGRHGREWISEKEAGLYFSIVLRPKIDVEFLPLITLMGAVAVSDVLSELYQITSDIKWSNDVLIGNKKICGVLAEAVETTRGLSVVLGIGINLTSSNFPPELDHTATSLKSETGKTQNRDELLASLTKFLTYFYNILHDTNGAKSIRNEWAKRSSYFSGKHVRALREKSSIVGVTDGIESNGALRIKTDRGIEVINAGDIETLRENRANNK